MTKLAKRKKVNRFKIEEIIIAFGKHIRRQCKKTGFTPTEICKEGIQYIKYKYPKDRIR